MSAPIPKFGTSVRARGYDQAPSYLGDSHDVALDVASWSVSGDAYFAVPTTTQKLPSGFYTCEISQNGPFLQRKDVDADQLIKLPDATTDMLLKEFVTFWEQVEKFKKFGLSAKRGILLWGPPGSGKTSSLQVMASHMIQELGGIVVMAGDPRIMIPLLNGLRRIEPDRPLIVVYEDIDALVDRYGEAEFLAMLDGEHQVSNVVNVATTNYPERLDARFADRPGRFDRVQYVPMPCEDARRCYFETRAVDVNKDTIERWVQKSEGWSIAHLRELIVSSQVLGEDSEDAIGRLNGMRVTPDSDIPPDKVKAEVGFGILGGRS